MSWRKAAILNLLSQRGPTAPTCGSSTPAGVSRMFSQSLSRRSRRGRLGRGVDVVEHPEAELHPAAHADIAELVLDNLVGRRRPMVVETHSEMVLLRARRWIAEGRLPAEDVLIYWIHAEPGRGSILRKIKINKSGDLDNWPDGVFVEDYEEIMAIRRAARPKE